MPGGDRTGPLGSGPMTGRAAGLCAGYPVPGYANQAGGRGFSGAGRGGRGGGGRVWRNRFYATGLPFWARYDYPYPATRGYGYSYPPREITAEDELRMLKEEADLMQKEVSDINERIRELESVSSKQKGE